MTRSGKVAPAMRQGISLVLTMLIVLGLTLGDVPIGGASGVAITEARVAAPEGGTGVAAAPKQARKRAERQHDHSRNDSTPKQKPKKDHKDNGHKQKGSEHKGHKPKANEPTHQQGKRDGSEQESKGSARRSARRTRESRAN
jgi:hypothetical protein